MSEPVFMCIDITLRERAEILTALQLRRNRARQLCTSKAAPIGMRATHDSLTKKLAISAKS